MPKLTISFKNTPEDLELYEEICKHSDKSAYIKDKLRNLRLETVQTTVVDKEQSTDIMLAQLNGLGIA